MRPNTLDLTETLLAHLICAEAAEHREAFGMTAPAKNGMQFQETDAGNKLAFASMRPRRAYTFQNIVAHHESDNDFRLYTTASEDLLAPTQEILGTHAEIAMISSDRVKWTGFRRMHKAPRGVWCGTPGSTYYEMHFREIFANGASNYFKRVAALNKKGRPVPCLVEGSSGNACGNDGLQLVMAASIIEDAHRSDAFTATIEDAAAIVIPVPIGEHKDLFALRDAPLNAAGRRKAILHWVAQHTRRSRLHAAAAIQIPTHLRGVRHLEVDGMRITLSPNLH